MHARLIRAADELLARPYLLMLDEPTEGVWHGVIDEIAERLAQLAQKIAVVIVQQHLKPALGVSQYCYVMDRGRIALRGESNKVRDDPELVRLLAP